MEGLLSYPGGSRCYELSKSKTTLIYHKAFTFLSWWNPLFKGNQLFIAIVTVFCPVFLSVPQMGLNGKSFEQLSEKTT